MNYKETKETFERFEAEKMFVKTTVPPTVDGAGKAALNRKGNTLFNSGNIEEARRIFQTTGYSDGLSRVGDYYRQHNKIIEALRMYWIAPDRTKYEPLVMQLAGILQNIIHEKEERSGDEL